MLTGRSSQSMIPGSERVFYTLSGNGLDYMDQRMPVNKANAVPVQLCSMKPLYVHVLSSPEALLEEISKLLNPLLLKVRFQLFNKHLSMPELSNVAFALPAS